MGEPSNQNETIAENADADNQSKKALKKQAKEAAKAAKVILIVDLDLIIKLDEKCSIIFLFQKAEHRAATNQLNNNDIEEGVDVSKDSYGNLKMICSDSYRKDRSFTKIDELSNFNGQQVWVRGRVHTSRSKGKQCFLILRQQSSTVQCLIAVNESVSKQMVKFSGS